MQVILLERIANMGGLGDEVEVKNGFARNFLIPQGKAVRATKTNRAEFEARRAELEKIAAEKLGQAEARQARLNDAEITIAARAGDEGKLFGSVGPREIADAFSAKEMTLTKAEVKMPEGPIRQTGEYSFDVQLHSDVFATIKVIVVGE